MVKEVRIRFAKKADLKEIINLCKLHAIFEKSEYSSLNKEQKLESYLFQENPTLYCLVVECDKKLVGYATYMKQFSTWDADFYVYMDCLFLIQKRRGLGIGEKLIERLRSETKKLNCQLIQWQTPNFNTRAMKFYERIGATSKTKERYFLNV